VSVTLVNEDDVRHQWMVHGLPSATYSMGMFNVEAGLGQTATGTFVTLANDTNLHLHCSLSQHEQKGMHGQVVVGDGTESHAVETANETGGTPTTGPPDSTSGSLALSQTATTAVVATGLLLAGAVAAVRQSEGD